MDTIKLERANGLVQQIEKIEQLINQLDKGYSIIIYCKGMNSVLLKDTNEEDAHIVNLIMRLVQQREQVKLTKLKIDLKLL